MPLGIYFKVSYLHLLAVLSVLKSFNTLVLWSKYLIAIPKVYYTPNTNFARVLFTHLTGRWEWQVPQVIVIKGTVSFPIKSPSTRRRAVEYWAVYFSLITSSAGVTKEAQRKRSCSRGNLFIPFPLSCNIIWGRYHFLVPSIFRYSYSIYMLYISTNNFQWSSFVVDSENNFSLSRIYFFWLNSWKINVLNWKVISRLDEVDFIFVSWSTFSYNILVFVISF